MKLFAWQELQDSFPADALRVHRVRTLLVHAAAIDATAAYSVFDLDHGGSVPLRVLARTGRTLRLTPARPLLPGRYVFTATHEGMFGGRDYTYLRVVPPGAAVTPISAKPDATAPAVIHSLLPVAATLLSCSSRSCSRIRSASGRPAKRDFGRPGPPLRRRDRRRGGRAAQWLDARRVPDVLPRRRRFTVAFLGAGSAWLLVPRRARDVLLGALAVAAAGAAVTVWLAPVDPATLSAAASGRPPGQRAWRTRVIWAAVLNTFGSVFLIGGSLLSIVRRQRVRTNAWIATGAIIVAAATGMSQLGDYYTFVYGGELLGIAFMFAGFRLVGTQSKGRPGTARALKPWENEALVAPSVAPRTTSAQ